MVFVVSMTEISYVDGLTASHGGSCKIQHLGYGFHDLVLPSNFPPLAFGTDWLQAAKDLLLSSEGGLKMSFKFLQG